MERTAEADQQERNLVMSDLSPVLSNSAFKDRRGGLIGFGIGLMIIGCFCALFVPLMLAGQAMTARTTGAAADYRTIIPVVMVYGVLAVVFIWLGIGSIKARRWARALALILGWAWLGIGIVSVGFMAVLMPKILASQPPTGQPLSAEAQFVATIVAVGFMSLFFVVLPGLLVFFYQSCHVKATCEARDPVVRWTDACPLPVLGMSLFLALGTVFMLPALLTYRAVTPCFGRYISGIPGAGLLVVMMALWVYCAWAMYRLRPAGWWTTLFVSAVMILSAMMTFAQQDLIEMYRLMGYPEKQIEQMRQFSFLNGPKMLLFMAVSSLPFFGYLIWIKKYFRQPAEGGN
jgi:hypothetical protein